MKLKRGSTSVRRLIFIADSASTVGAGLANLVYNTASLVAYYFAGDLSNEVQISLATATLGTFTSGGFVAVDNTNMPGWYEIGIPNAALDGGNECVIQLRGAANMVPVNVYIELDSFDYQTATQPVNVTQFGGTNGTFASGIPTAALDSAVTLQLDGIEDDAAASAGYGAASVGYLTTLMARITSGVAQMFQDLIAMISGSGTADAKFDAMALSLAPSAGGGLTGPQAEQLTEIHEGLFPDDPDTSPVVITPGAAEFVTVWFRCYSQLGIPIGGIVIKYQTDLPPGSQNGFGFQSVLTTVTSAGNGLVQMTGIPLGCNLAIYSGSPATRKTFQIPTTTVDGTYSLPSLIV